MVAAVAVDVAAGVDWDDHAGPREDIHREEFICSPAIHAANLNPIHAPNLNLVVKPIHAEFRVEVGIKDVRTIVAIRSRCEELEVGVNYLVVKPLAPAGGGEAVARC